MHAAARQLRPLFQVALPVAVAVVLVCLAVLNMALVKTWPGEAEDGVLWQSGSGTVVAAEVALGSAAYRAGIQKHDQLWQLDGKEIKNAADVEAILHAASPGHRLKYAITRDKVETPIVVELQPMPTLREGLYYSLALVGVLSIVVGSSVRLRRPNDTAALEFLWLTVALLGGLGF
jgi:membrane-associated protease RseP (regulator of RpoE activity)